jgi:hypothetical protein
LIARTVLGVAAETRREPAAPSWPERASTGDFLGGTGVLLVLHGHGCDPPAATGRGAAKKDHFQETNLSDDVDVTLPTR